jgi:glutamyl endopeptidase
MLRRLLVGAVAAAAVLTAGAATADAGAPSAEKVIGADNRKQVANTTKFPKSAVVSVVSSGGGGFFSCTGFLIDDDVVATAAHCTQPPGLATYTVVPGQNGLEMPFGSFGANQVFVPPQWDGSEGSRHDYAAIVLDGFVTTESWFELVVVPAAQLPGTKVRLNGYPFDKPAGTQWKSKGKIKEVVDGLLTYKNDTFAGMSGAPVYANFGGCSNCVTGIHTVALLGRRNAGVRVNSGVVNFFADAISHSN